MEPSHVRRRSFFNPDFQKTVVLVLGIFATLYAIGLYLRATTPEDATYVPKPAVITPEVILLQEYVRIDTSNPPGREVPGAQFLVDQLQRAGVQPELIESAPGRVNVYARIRGRRPDEGLLLLHHIDVYPADRAGWEKSPFGAEIYLNQIWGRGTLDMKGIAICHLAGFLDVARSGRPPERDLIYLATADEETGSELGLGWLVKHRRDIFHGVRYAITEGGVPEMKAEQLMYFGIEVGSKIFGLVRLRSPSRERLQEARIALEPYMQPYDPDRVLPEVRRFFKAIAPYRVHGREILADVDWAVAEGEFWKLQTSFRALTQDTLLPGGILPDGNQFVLDVYLQTLPDAESNRMIQRLREIVGMQGVEIEVVTTMEPTRISSDQTSFFQLMTAKVRQHHGANAPVGPLILSNTTTDSRYLRRLGIDSYGFCPYFVDFIQSGGIHGSNERIRLDWFQDGVELTRDLVTSYCLSADK